MRYFRIITANIIMVCFLVGCVSPSKEIGINDTIITNMEMVNNYEGLIEYYKSELNNDKVDHLNIKEKLALIYFKKGDIESARFYVKHLRDKGVDSAKIYQLEGQINDASSDINKAISSYLLSIERGNKSGEIHVLIAVSYIKLGFLEDAYKHLNIARLLGYNDITIKNNIAMIHLFKGDYALAIEVLHPIFIENPSNKVIKTNLIVALIKNEKVDVAKKLLKEDFSYDEINMIIFQLTDFRDL